MNWRLNAMLNKGKEYDKNYEEIFRKKEEEKKVCQNCGEELNGKKCDKCGICAECG